MQRVTAQEDRERGAGAVIIALLMVVLLGFGALAVDAGLLYAEKAQLQNGADAAALSVAQACALKTANCSETSPLAADLANKNSLDNLSTVRSIAIDSTNQKVAVSVDSREAGRTDNRVSLYFASVLGIPTAPAGARSTAAWGSPRQGPIVFPLAMSVCQVKNMVDKDVQLIRSHTASSDKHASCPDGPAGKDAPGGFGWLATPSGTCALDIDLDAGVNGTEPVVDAKTGNEAPGACKAVLDGWVTELQAGRTVRILLPVFHEVNGTGANTKYTLTAFAALNVHGWKFDGDGILPWTFRPTTTSAGTTCVNSCRGIRGQFVSRVALSDVFQKLGPVSPYGVTAVKLIN